MEWLHKVNKFWIFLLDRVNESIREWFLGKNRVLSVWDIFALNLGQKKFTSFS